MQTIIRKGPANEFHAGKNWGTRVVCFWVALQRHGFVFYTASVLLIWTVSEESVILEQAEEGEDGEQVKKRLLSKALLRRPQDATSVPQILQTPLEVDGLPVRCSVVLAEPCLHWFLTFCSFSLHTCFWQVSLYKHLVWVGKKNHCKTERHAGVPRKPQQQFDNPGLLCRWQGEIFFTCTKV